MARITAPFHRSIAATGGILVALALLAAACGPAEAEAVDPASVVAGQQISNPAAAPAIAVVDDAEAIVAAQEQVLGRIYDSVVPSLVSIQVSQGLARQGEGSGFVWDDRGRIVTNHHVVEGVESVVVVFADGTRMEARVLGSDPDSDLAVLQLEGEPGVLTPVTLGDSDAVGAGQMAVALGNPFGQEFTMTTGIVSAVGRTIRSGNSPFSIPRVIQTDAAINPGNSGGPLLDRQGRVIGVNTQILSRSGSFSGIGFAVPINMAKRVIPVLIDKGRYEYAWLGISGVPLAEGVARLMDLPAGTRGAQVVETVEDGPAWNAGLRGSERSAVVGDQPVAVGGDVIVGADGTPIQSMDDLISYLIEHTGPGDEVVLDILRDKGEPDQVKVELGKRPSGDGVFSGR